MADLSEKDEAEILKWKEARILQKVAQEDFLHKNGVVIFSCPDGHRFPDLYGKHEEECRCNDEKAPMIHMLTDHGGALVLAENSPVNRPTEQMVDMFLTLLERIFPCLLWQILGKMRLTRRLAAWIARRADIFALWRIRMAILVKGCWDLSLYAHAPCGAANAHGLGANELLHAYMRGWRRCIYLFAGVRIRCFFHVCYANGKQRTYLVKKNAAVRWLGQNTHLPPIL